MKLKQICINQHQLPSFFQEQKEDFLVSDFVETLRCSSYMLCITMSGIYVPHTCRVIEKFYLGWTKKFQNDGKLCM